MKMRNLERNDMHRHSFTEITQYFAEDIGNFEDEILHVFECPCGFTLVEKRRPVKSNSGQKKMTIYTVIRKDQNFPEASAF